MLKKIGESFLLAIQNIRARFFHTLLSVLCIVIGVAALVAILSLIDGMEEFAKEQISTTTSLNAVTVHSRTSLSVNDVNILRDTYSTIDYKDMLEAQRVVPQKATFYLLTHLTAEVVLEKTSKKIGTRITGTGVAIHPLVKDALTGRLFTERDLLQGDSVAVVNGLFLMASGFDSLSILNQKVLIRGIHFRVVGVAARMDERNAHVAVPITLFPTKELHDNPPEMVIDVASTLDVNTVKEAIQTWLTKKYGKDEFNISTNQLRLKQAEQGFLLFRVIMGMIVGISVLVGGIGVMNVLLISVTQRTTEIGVRKAVGASKKDILFLFLAESITVSAFGSFMGLIVGVIGTMAAIPIIRAVTKVPFQAAYTFSTLLVISIIAILIGVVFGTYPAWRASRLDPVEAIRRE